MSFRIGLSFDKMHFTCNWVDLWWFKSSRNMLFKSRVKAMQIYSRNKWRSAVFYIMTNSSANCIYRDLKGNFSSMLDSCSTNTLSIENYKIQISWYIFHAYPSFLFRFSFLTTLDIYKDCFKGHFTWCN